MACAEDTMIQNSSLTNGQTLTSTRDFQLGFFSLDNSPAKGYLGIWYCNFTPQEGTIIWIANRNKSVNTSMASFNLTSDGNLILFEEDRNVWSTGTRSTGLNSARLQLLDSGNLVLTVGDWILWQSFDSPNGSGTSVPGMKLGFDKQTNTSWRRVSWKNSTDPSPGECIQMIRVLPIPDFVTLKGSTKYHRIGLWNGYRLVSYPSMASSSLEANPLNGMFVSNENESYATVNYTAWPTPVLIRSTLWANGTFQGWLLDRGDKREWQLLWSTPADECDKYNRCGRNKVCTWNVVVENCNCLDGFVKIVENGSEDGCKREKPLNCSSNQFSKVPNVKLPDTENATPRGNTSLDDCKNLCLNDCSCVAFAGIKGTSECVTWRGDLLDLRTFVDEGEDLYVRLAGKNSTGRRMLFIVVSIAASLLFLCAIFIYRRRKKATIRRGNLLAATFNNSKRKQLDWARRFKIIEGISRGLLYLHEDSPLKIIHRDLKANNILLDANMDPKISDFGLAKLFGVDETQGNTRRIAGTFGYMAPEYALHGLFSVKSDVYSYGVLVLEILTSQKNIGHRGSEYPIELVTHVVWRHWAQGSALQVIDHDLVEQCQAPQILSLPTPSAPAFLSNRNPTSESNDVPRRESSNGSKGILMKISENNVSISALEPRAHQVAKESTKDILKLKNHPIRRINPIILMISTLKVGYLHSDFNSVISAGGEGTLKVYQ
ncbi:hypothetical protein ZIOFF_029136 [Zingiber officinale]|uniref:Receptor-like serine/threonine-protein kinase n=1 Tax=Zingiber officinale TaxID=94328 RepID=A0A8J5GP44_ZINOF|nr:hypothetical protein ZIOFF_029136 [Zingiber officinale]